TFSEVREYQPGDPTRLIDWNVTARFNHPYVKVFEEERELTMILIVDVSGSQQFGTNVQFKNELITELCAVLSFSAIQNNDKTGIIFFSDQIEKFIPPKKGKSHILRIIRELIEFTPKHKGTDLSSALRFFTNAIKKRSIAFVISDFADAKFEDALKVAARKHDVVAIRVADQREKSLPDIGMAKFVDNETGKSIWVDTSDAGNRKIMEKLSHGNEKKLTDIFTRSGVDNVTLFTGQSYVRPLMSLFKKRERRF
ncbi:MAG TPA: DUF58 domain-containing protein, partial [Bacteroidia bacterium]|nr:DUF58 domain-containing protein [Bacteroidia bacterium]